MGAKINQSVTEKARNPNFGRPNPISLALINPHAK